MNEINPTLMKIAMHNQDVQLRMSTKRIRELEEELSDRNSLITYMRAKRCKKNEEIVDLKQELSDVTKLLHKAQSRKKKLREKIKL